jgi:hypothetical protein
LYEILASTICNADVTFCASWSAMARVFASLQQDSGLVILGQLLESGLGLLASERGWKKEVGSDSQVMLDGAARPLDKTREKKVPKTPGLRC